MWKQRKEEQRRKSPLRKKREEKRQKEHQHQCPGPLGSCSPVCPRGLLWCVCGVLGQLAPVHRCARSVCCVACAVSWAPGLLFTGVRAVCGARVPWVVVSLFLPPFWFFFFTCFFFLFFGKKKKKKQKRGKQRRAYTAGTGMGSWCGGAIALCPLACVVGAVAAVAPQGCGSRVLMYMGMGQGGFG